MFLYLAKRKVVVFKYSSMYLTPYLCSVHTGALFYNIMELFQLVWVFY